MQLNDTHPTLALIELFRILMDEKGLTYGEAFSIVQRIFNYTNHTVLPEALEKWGVDIFKRLSFSLYYFYYIFYNHFLNLSLYYYQINNLKKHLEILHYLYFYLNIYYLFFSYL